MNKPDSLRKAIESAIPALKRDAERFLIFIDRGNIRSQMTADHSFEIRYTLNVIITDFATDSRILFIAILNWLRINQPDALIGNRQAMQFDADILDNKSADFAIELQLTENVNVVQNDDGGFDMQYAGEFADPLRENDSDAIGAILNGDTDYLITEDIRPIETP